MDPAQTDQAAADPAQPSHTATQSRVKSFQSTFNATTTELTTSIEALLTAPPASQSETIQQLLTDLSTLSISVLDAAPFLPAYDQRSCTDRVRTLQHRLAEVRSAVQPRARFAFRSRREAPAAGDDDAPEARRSQGAGQEGGASREEVEEFVREYTPKPVVQKDAAKAARPKDRPRRPAASALANQLRIVGKFEASIPLTRDANDDGPPASTADIDGLRWCIVNGFPASGAISTLETISMTGSSGCVLLLGRISGALHVTGLRNCVIVASCGQLRMHDSRDVDVHLWCGSSPIVENCIGVRFAQIPGQFLEGDGPAAGQANCWDRVLDFGWQRREPSPNWSLLPAGEDVQAGMWEVLREGFASTGDAIKALLEHILPMGNE